MAKYCLYGYVCLKWGHHARERPVPGTLIMRLLKDDAKLIVCAQLLMRRRIIIPP